MLASRKKLLNLDKVVNTYKVTLGGIQVSALWALRRWSYLWITIDSHCVIFHNFAREVEVIDYYVAILCSIVDLLKFIGHKQTQILRLPFETVCRCRLKNNISYTFHT